MLRKSLAHGRRIELKQLFTSATQLQSLTLSNCMTVKGTALEFIPPSIKYCDFSQMCKLSTVTMSWFPNQNIFDL